MIHDKPSNLLDQPREPRKLGDLLPALTTTLSSNRSKPISLPATESPPPAPTAPKCTYCNDLGAVYPAVPADHPDYHRSFDCPYCEAGRRRAQERLTRRFAFSCIPAALQAYSLDSFAALLADADSDKHTALNIARHYVTHASVEVPTQGKVALKNSLLFSGPAGSGKTGLMVAVANTLIRQFDVPVRFMNVPDLLDHLRAAFHPQSEVRYDDLFETIRGVTLLALDDLGAEENVSPWALRALYQVINHRANHALPTMVSTNLTLNDLAARFALRDSADGERIASRLRGMAVVVHVGGRDLRS